jgi:hypothetical protein
MFGSGPKRKSDADVPLTRLIDTSLAKYRLVYSARVACPGGTSYQPAIGYAISPLK